MRILNVNFSLDLKRGTGTAERTFQMSRFLARRGVQCTVLAMNIGLDDARIAALAPATTVVVGSLWERFNVPRIRWGAIRRLVAEADVVHLMGHWSVLNALVYVAIRRAEKPYVVCPAGALPLFGRSRWLKRLYNVIVGNAIIRNASAWIAVTEGEFPHFETYGIPPSKVAVIPNGVSAEDFPVEDIPAFLSRYKLPDASLILFMGRLNLIKGPDLLLRAFILARNRLPGYHLVFAGADAGMMSTLQDLVTEAGLKESVHFIGHVQGADKSAAYRCATLLVVSSRQEAMSIVALEAGVCGTPVLLTDQCGFTGISAVDSRLEVPATEAGIEEGLIRLLADPHVLEQVAPKWCEFVEKRYNWNVIITSYLNLYAGLLDVESCRELDF
jgi:glycosyltransferase involved in cell wall biosynthesis